MRSSLNENFSLNPSKCNSHSNLVIVLSEKPNLIKPVDPSLTATIKEELGEELKTKLEAHSAVP